MMNELKSIFKDEIYLHLTLRKEELGSEAYRHYKYTVRLFDEYLYGINLSEKSIDESVIDGWIKKISYGISINTVTKRLQLCAEHGTNLASESLATGIYRQV